MRSMTVLTLAMLISFVAHSVSHSYAEQRGSQSVYWHWVRSIEALDGLHWADELAKRTTRVVQYWEVLPVGTNVSNFLKIITGECIR